MSPEPLVSAYALAPGRTAIAEAVAARFGADLERGVDPEGEQAWLSAPGEGRPSTTPKFADFSFVYGNGEFTWAGLWTVTDPPGEVQDELIGAWEMFPPPTSRWQLPVRPEARIWDIHRPEDWVRLVEAYPKVATEMHSGWELPGPNQRLHDILRVLALRHQHALRASVDRHVLPDWGAVAKDYDGVHLSWGGFLTSEGFVSDLPGGGVTMLRYWASERTLWLADVFGEPVPLPAPALSGDVDGDDGIDVRHDAKRRERDLVELRTWLGRSPV